MICCTLDKLYLNCLYIAFVQFSYLKCKFPNMGWMISLIMAMLTGVPGNKNCIGSIWFCEMKKFEYLDVNIILTWITLTHFFKPKYPPRRLWKLIIWDIGDPFKDLTSPKTKWLRDLSIYHLCRMMLLVPHDVTCW